MRVYIGQTRSRALIARLSALGFGECAIPGELPPRRTPYFLDNGAFRAWKAGTPFDGEAFLTAAKEARTLPVPPDFLVLPDIVAGGRESLAFSLAWLPAVFGWAPLYLCVQDGVTEQDMERHVGKIDGIFVGGTLEWKVATGAAWVRFAHANGLPCHVGRVGAANRVRWARRINADSIDSCLPLWSQDNLARFVAALNDQQRELFHAA